ncbi:terminase small subunit, partial [Stenotrophomonas maltophilia group sp. RNC7]|uniref:terminase small subunit n=1 Tax=Stenotrophomonas maltophilia group sp. RNC7 TaxID=3071467 RepID=UPI0027E1E0FB
MTKLTVKQKAFCDYYIETGNATEAAVRAGYSEKTAKVIGSENLTKPYIKSYIDDRLKSIEDKRIAKGEEVLQYLTKVMRGEEKDQFGLD